MFGLTLTGDNLIRIGFVERDAPKGRSFHRISDKLELIVFEEKIDGIVKTVNIISNLSEEQLHSIELEISELE